ncbi:hypothetical protein JOC78_000800 [Bacillus ectoiniformans]|nr:hypothetical protein [Bacillus ectoiniformans]
MDTGFVTELFNNMGLKIIAFIIPCALAFLMSFLLLRFLKVPYEISNFLSGIIFLVTMYYSFQYTFSPNS